MTFMPSTSSPALRRRFALATAALVTFLAPSFANAQPTNATRAEGLFQEAVKLMDEGHPSEACPKFAESHKLDPSYGAIFNLAECYSTLGRTASSWAAYVEASDLASKAGDQKRKAEALERARAIEPKLIRLSISIAGPATDLVVRADGLVVPAASYAQPVPVDPGPHTVSAARPGYETWYLSISFETPGSASSIAVPALKPLSRPESPAAVTHAAPTDETSVSVPTLQKNSPQSGIDLWGLGLTVAFGSAGLDPTGIFNPDRALLAASHVQITLLRVQLGHGLSVDAGPTATIEGIRTMLIGTPSLNFGGGGLFAALNWATLYGNKHLVGPRLDVLAVVGAVDGTAPFKATIASTWGPGVGFWAGLDIFGVRVRHGVELTMGMFTQFAPLWGHTVYDSKDVNFSMNAFGGQISAR